MAEPISEQIVARIITRLKLIKTPTYKFNLDVVRGDEDGEPLVSENANAKAQVVARAPVKDYALSYCGRDAYRMMVGIFVTLGNKKGSSTEPTTLMARMLAEIDKVLSSDRNCNGLAADAIPVTPQVGWDDQLAGVQLAFDVLFFTARNNPDSL